MIPGARRARASGLVGAVLVVVGLIAAAALALPGVMEKPRKVTLSVKQHGTVAGLYPGSRATVTVVVRNGSRKTVRLKSVSAAPKALPGCPASMLRIPAVRSKKVIKPRKSLRVTLPAQLSRAAPDACQGKTFRLALKATGTQAR